MDIQFEITGQGEPVLLLCGAFADLHIWDHVTDILSAKYQVIRMNYRAPYTLNAFTSDVNALLDHLEMASTHIVGHSMGGFVGMNFSAQHPEKVRSLSLLSSIVAINQSGFDFLDGLLAQAKIDPELLRDQLADLTGAKQSIDTIIQQTKLCRAHDARPYAHLIKAPVLCLYGSQEEVFDENALREMKAALKNCRVTKALDCGHMLPLEAPKEVAIELLEFFKL